MAVRKEIRVGDEVPIQINFKEDGAVFDVSSATVLEMWIEKPSGVPMKVIASFLTDGTDGSIIYNFAQGEVDEEGQWKYQGHAESASWKVTSKKAEFYVDEVIDVTGL